MMDKPNNQELPLLAAIFTSLLCVSFGANAVAVKISLSGLGPFTTAAVRFALAALGIFIWAKVTRRSFGFKKGQMQQLLILSILFTAQMALFHFGLSKTNASRGTLLTNLQPFFLLILAHYFIWGDRITKKKIIGLSIGFIGMALVFIGKKDITNDIQIGDSMILAGAFLWACNTVYTKRIINAFDPFQLVLFPMIFSVPFFLVLGYYLDGTMIAHIDIEVICSILYQGLLTASFGYVAWNYLLQKYGAVSLHSFVFIMPISGVILGGVLLGEPITHTILLALVLIVLGILVINLRTKNTKDPSPGGAVR